MRIRTAMMAGLAVAVLAGCGAQESAQSGPRAGADEWRNGSTTSSDNRSATYQQRTGPVDAPMPGGMPVYANMKPGSRYEQKTQVRERDAHLVAFRTTDRPEQVTAFYIAAAQRAGMRVTERFTKEGIEVIMLGGGELTLGLTVQVPDGGPETAVTVTGEKNR